MYENNIINLLTDWGDEKLKKFSLLFLFHCWLVVVIKIRNVEILGALHDTKLKRKLTSSRAALSFKNLFLYFLKATDMRTPQSAWHKRTLISHRYDQVSSAIHVYFVDRVNSETKQTIMACDHQSSRCLQHCTTMY